MKGVARVIGLAVAVLIIALPGFVLMVRLAPSDVGVWHMDMTAATFQPPENGQVVCIRTESRQGPSAVGAAMLARLDAIALATPRTERLAGGVAEGRITWITRSALIGYPDYTTAQLMPGPTLCILGRQRFGAGDWGVNAARVGGWAQALLGLPDPVAMTGF